MLRAGASATGPLPALAGRRAAATGSSWISLKTPAAPPAPPSPMAEPPSPMAPRATLPVTALMAMGPLSGSCSNGLWLVAPCRLERPPPMAASYPSSPSMSESSLMAWPPSTGSAHSSNCSPSYPPCERRRGLYLTLYSLLVSVM